MYRLHVKELTWGERSMPKSQNAKVKSISKSIVQSQSHESNVKSRDGLIWRKRAKITASGSGCMAEQERSPLWLWV
jgi:hypothetical protein